MKSCVIHKQPAAPPPTYDLLGLSQIEMLLLYTSLQNQESEEGSLLYRGIGFALGDIK